MPVPNPSVRPHSGTSAASGSARRPPGELHRHRFEVAARGRPSAVCGRGGVVPTCAAWASRTNPRQRISPTADTCLASPTVCSALGRTRALPRSTAATASPIPTPAPWPQWVGFRPRARQDRIDGHGSSLHTVSRPCRAVSFQSRAPSVPQAADVGPPGSGDPARRTDSGARIAQAASTTERLVQMCIEARVSEARRWRSG